MEKPNLEQMLKAGVHFGHVTRRWNPKMKPYIFMEKNGIHIIDLHKTQAKLEEAMEALQEVLKEGYDVLFVGTKKQAKHILKEEASRCGMPYMVERWLGGTLTNFSTIRKSIKHLESLEKKAVDGTYEKITKKERLMIDREKAKMKQVFEGIQSMKRLPGALFIIDVKKEAIAVNEAKKLNIPIFAVVDTNCDPDYIDYPIPGNDDSNKSIRLFSKYFADQISETRKFMEAAKKDEIEAASEEQAIENAKKEKEAGEKEVAPKRPARKPRPKATPKKQEKGTAPKAKAATEGKSE